MTAFLTIEGHRIAYTSAGSPFNPPVLFLHGIMSHRGVWSHTIETLRKDFYCIAIDHLGFGDSDKPRDGDYAISRQAERALEVADSFGFDKFSIVGHSMGGQIATYLASRIAPSRVHKLVSVAGVVTGRLSNRVENVNRKLIIVGEKFPGIYNLSFRLTQWKPLAQSQFDGIWFHKSKEIPFDSWELDRRMALNPDCALSTPKAWNSINNANLTPHLKSIGVPTFVIFGKQDGTVPVEQAYLFKEQLPTAELVVIDDCGHFPMYEKFDEYIVPLKTFLKS